jgi:hypothetical protein
MQVLNIKHSPFIVVRRVIGVITLICAISMLLSKLGAIRFFDWIFFSTFIVSGVSLLTDGFGTEKSFIQSGDGFLKIKWMNKLRPVIFQDKEIEKITLSRFKIIIDRKENKPVKFNIDFLERDQKKEVYEFLIQYTKNKNLELVKDF